MHEYSLAKALLRQVDVIVRRERAAEVRRVSVTIGEFSGVDPDLLQMAFEDISKQSPHAGVRLSIEQVALEARCEDCYHEFQVARFRFVCPNCEGGSVNVIRGEEMVLEQVVLETK